MEMKNLDQKYVRKIIMIMVWNKVGAVKIK